MDRYLPRYNERQRHRHDVSPGLGLTGWAQIKGQTPYSYFKLPQKYIDSSRRMAYYIV